MSKSCFGEIPNFPKHFHPFEIIRPYSTPNWCTFFRLTGSRAPGAGGRLRRALMTAAEDVRKTCGRHGPKPWPDIQPEMDAAWFKHDAIMLHLSAMDFLWTLQGPSLSKSSFILHLMFVFIAKSVSSSHLKPSSMFSKVPSYRNLALRFYAAFA